MDLMRSALHETMQRFDKQIQVNPTTSIVRSHIPSPAAHETFRVGALNVQRGVGVSC
jgi:glucan phosphorylase